MDNEDIKKVNNEEAEAAQKSQKDAEKSEINTDAFDEIMNGMYDLARIYGNDETTREREMREKDEKRREAEMAAIREDIERRYSMQVEEAKSNMDSIMGVSSANANQNPEKPTATINLEAIREDGTGKKQKIKKEKAQKSKRKKEKKQKEIEYIDLEEKNGVYIALYSLGDIVVRLLERFLGLIIHAISIPIKKIRRAFKSATAGTKRKFKSFAKDYVKEIVYFRQEIKSANKNIFRALRHPLSIPSIFIHYIAKAINRHKQLLRTVFNIAVPIGALVVLIAVFNYWNNVTFALDVIYNDEHIGYISDESVFTSAKDMVIDRLSANTVNSDVTSVSVQSLNAGYELALVSLDELNDARTISDEMIKHSSDNLTNACGIYIDGDFICAVKNESDAKTVFYNILSPYEEDSKNEGYVVSFAEDIDYVQGLYPDNESTMWDASRLETTVLGGEGATVYYTVMEGDTLDSIAKEYSTTADYLLSINSSLSSDSLTAGSTINVPSYEKMVNIKKTYTTSKIASIPYDTVKQRDATKYSGYRLVRQEGVDGTQRIITTKTYINDVLTDTSKRSEVLVEATDEIIVVGTRTTYGGIYIGEASEKGFLWPAPHCHYISSPYGWRSSGWHKGVDLCTTDGTANGSPVIASMAGTVEVVQRSSSGYGNMVLINHGDGYKTRYAHMLSGSITVSTGDHVEAGQSIGKVGSTGNSSGPHLHFEVIYNGETQNPINYIS